jgi:hypothetical protein
MLKLNEGHMNVIYTCSNDESTRFNEGVFIIINFDLMKFSINKNMVIA